MSSNYSHIISTILQHFQYETEFAIDDDITYRVIPTKFRIISNQYNFFELNNYDADRLKPILYPIKDLFKDEYSNLREHICENSLEYLDSELPIISIVNNLKYSEVQILLKHHFDIFDLINKGSAIDKNLIAI